jgi:GNAT superfamily N-acetyltransferase
MIGLVTGTTDRKSAVPVRLARPDDLDGIGDLERAAGEAFRTIGMDLVADDTPPPVEHLAGYQSSGRMWVATDRADRPIAYCLVDVVDGATHLEQLTVTPDWARQRIGGQLIEVVAGWAREVGRPVLTLLTFRYVPWNAPYYRRLGFTDIPEALLTPGLRALGDVEERLGLTRWPRVAMRRG